MASRATEQTVFVVDDDPALLSALQFALELEGFTVATFRASEDLLAMTPLPGAGCLVIDYKLPGMDGLELVAALRSRSVTLPAILITTHANASLRQRAAAGGTQIIEKPLLGDALLDAIRGSLKGQAGMSGPA